MIETFIIHPQLRDVQIGEDGYSARYRDLLFIVSRHIELDGKVWLHTSVSRRDKSMPTYDDMITLKRICIGDHRTAYQVFPPAEKHIDIAGKLWNLQVLHLWSCESGAVTPDFTRGGNTI